MTTDRPHDAGTAPQDAAPVLVEYVASYVVSCLPRDNMEHMTWGVEVVNCGSRLPDKPDRCWAIRSMSRCLSRKGEWVHEPSPSNRTDRWIRAHRFTETEALERARQVVPTIVVNGLTAADVVRIQTERGSHA
jgi:hypothetical protein